MSKSSHYFVELHKKEDETERRESVDVKYEEKKKKSLENQYFRFRRDSNKQSTHLSSLSTRLVTSAGHLYFSIL